MRHMQTFIDGLIFTLAFILIPVASLLADPPGGEDILYPGSGTAAPSIGNPFIQIDAGISQSTLQSSSGFRVPEEGSLGVPGYLKSANGTAPFAGLMLGYRFNSAFSFGVRVDYDSRHAANTGTTQVPCTLYDPETGEAVEQQPVDVQDKYSATVDYLSISALPAVHFENFYFYAGPSIGIPLSRSISETATLAEHDEECQFFFGTEDATSSITGSLGGKTNLKQRLGLKFGLGYLHPLTSRIGLAIQAGADVGSTDLFETKDELHLQNPNTTGGSTLISTLNANQRFHALQGSIGLRINL